MVTFYNGMHIMVRKYGVRQQSAVASSPSGASSAYLPNGVMNVVIVQGHLFSERRSAALSFGQLLLSNLAVGSFFVSNGKDLLLFDRPKVP